VANRLREAVEEEEVAGLPVTMSFGVASSEGNPLDPVRLYEDADAALYRAKQGGRNRVEQAQPARAGEQATGETWLARPSQPGNRVPAGLPRIG